MPDVQKVAREIGGLCYGSLFLPEIGGRDCLVESMAFLAATERLDADSGQPNHRNSWLHRGFDESDLDVGADHLMVQVLDDNPMADPPPALRTLAQALELG
jgi:hypothetical protein